MKRFLQIHHNSTRKFKWIEYLWEQYPDFRISGDEPSRTSSRIRRHNCYVTLTSSDQLLIHFNDESGEYGNIQQDTLDLDDVSGYEYYSDGNVGKKIKGSKTKKIKSKRIKKSKIKPANGCKKTSLCACKHVKCMVKPRRCAGITKCSRGKKYSR